MKRVGVFIPSLGFGIVERNIIYLSNGLIERGFDVDILMADSVKDFFRLLPASAGRRP